MADITPIASLKGEIAPTASLAGELAMPEKVLVPASEMTDEEILQSLIAANVLSAVTSGGAILTDENHNILMM